MKTRITELLGIKYPIIQGGMGLVSDVRLTVAVSEAGGLGVLSPFGMTGDELRESISSIREQTDKPFGVNIMEGTPGGEEFGRIVAEERIPIVSHGKGSPAWLIHLTKGQVAIAMPTIGALSHAVKAEQDGADAIVVQGMEGGGHTGYISSLVLLPLVVSRVKVPVIAAGGFCDGRGLAAALALGAEGIYMGTRFAITQESPLNEAAKQRYLLASEKDTVVTPLVTGTRSRGVKNKLTDLLELEGGRFPWTMAIRSALRMRKTFHFSLLDMLLCGLKMKRASNVAFKDLGSLVKGYDTLEKFVKGGDIEWGWMPAGQVVGMIEDIPTCRKLIERTVKEAETILDTLGKKVRA